jgi:hypothetical protein
MGFQSTINYSTALGVPGEIYDNSSTRVQPFNLNSADASYNVFGRAFSIVSEGVVAAGNTTGSLVFGGILVAPKSSPLYGTSGGTLNPSLTLPNNQLGALLNMGQIIVTLPAAAAIGDLVIFDNTTGILETIAPNADLPSGKSPAFAVVTRFTVSAAGLAVIQVTTTPTIPVPAA